MGRITDPYIIGPHGEIEGSATAKQLTDVECGAVILKALSANTGSIYVGTSNAVTAPTGSDSATSGIELAPGDSIELMVQNLKDLWIICANAADDLTYICYNR